MVKIEDIRERLVSDPIDVPSWVHVDPGSIRSIVAALDYWLKAAPKKTVKGVLKYHEYKSPAGLFDNVMSLPGISPEFKQRAQENKSRVEQQVIAFVDSLSDEDLQAKGYCRPGVPMPKVRILVKEFLIDDILTEQGAGGGRGTDALEEEMEWYKKMNCFYPPKELENRHPAFVALKKQIMEQEARGEHPNPDKQLVYAVRIFLPFGSFYEPGSRHPICLRIFSEYIRPRRNTTGLGSPSSRSL